MSGAPALPPEFFERPPRQVARDLIGCALACGEAGGLIVETEAYEEDDPACHAYVGRTARTEVLFGPPGRAYVYLSYGIHSLFNVVTDRDGTAAAVLIRALQPVCGIELMRSRRRRQRLRELCSGPGKLTEALGIDLALNGVPVCEAPLQLDGPPAGSGPPRIVSGPRIGITKAADLPWRYCLADSDFLSRPAG